MKYRSEIDGLRALAVVPVVLFHAGFKPFSGGFVGVDIFFVISGYLITSIILSEIRQGNFSLLNFYEKRARRILPVLFVVQFFCFLYAWCLLLPSEMASFSKSLIAVSTFMSNLFFWSERGYFGTTTELKPLIHTWSLGIEEQYYLLFPLILIFLSKKKNLLYPILITVGAISLLLCGWLTRVHADSAFYLLPTRFWELLVGSLVAIQFTNNANTSARSTLLATLLESIGFLFIIFPIFYFDERTPFPGYAALIPTMGAALVIRYSTSSTFFGTILSKRPMVVLGLISYSIYLWHQAMFALLRHLYEGEPSSWSFFFACIVVIGVSFLSWKYIEQPFRDKMLWTRKSIFAISSGCMVFFILLGIAGWKTDGFINRYSQPDQRLLMSFVGAEDYVSARFDSLKLIDFPVGDHRKKILVIGDSYGKDIVNAVAESELKKYVTISTDQINKECGNLFLEADFTKHIDDSNIARCKLLGWYDNPKLQKLIRESDVIWLASSWTEWVAPLVAESVERLQHQFGKPVYVFGRKNFGIVNQVELLRLAPEDRSHYTVQMDETHIRVQEIMRKSLPAGVYVDISQLLCQSDVSCKLFDANGGLISFDGAHLTKDGAAYLGSRLYEDAIIKEFLERPDSP